MTNLKEIEIANQDYFDSAVGNENPIYKKVIIKTDSAKRVVEYNPTIANYLNGLGFIDCNSETELEMICPETETTIPVEMTFYPNEKNEIRFTINIDAEDLEEILEYEI